MPITTYARLEHMLQTTDPDICEALGVLRHPPVVKEIPRRLRTAWFPIYEITTAYSILWFLQDTPHSPEWQVVNFYRDSPATAHAGVVVTKELVLAYLYGCATQQREPTP